MKECDKGEIVEWRACTQWGEILFSHVWLFEGIC